MTGRAFALGPCWSCKRIFVFNPSRVPSIPIDPRTSKPVDVDPDPATPDQRERLARAVREPVCEDCIQLANDQRAAAGRPLIHVLPGAYDAAEPGEL